MSEEEADLPSKRRRKALFLGSSMLLGTVGLGVTAMASNEENKADEFYSSANDNIGAFANEINDKEYDVLDVSSQELDVETNMNEVIFELGAKDVFEYDGESVIDTLSQGQYLEEGADFFGTVADNMEGTTHLETFSMRFDAGIGDNTFEYKVSTDELQEVGTRQDYEEFYAETFPQRVHQ